LSGREGSADTGILAAFGGDDAAVGDAMLLLEAGGAPPLPPRRHVREWVAAGIVAAIIGGGVYLYLGVLPAADQRDEVATTAQLQGPSTQPDTPLDPSPDIATVTTIPDGGEVATMSATDARESIAVPEVPP